MLVVNAIARGNATHEEDDSKHENVPFELAGYYGYD